MDLTVPAEPRFVSIAAAMTKLVAEQLGYPVESAARLAADFNRQTAGLDPANGPIAIHYEGSQAGLRVHVRAGKRSFELAPL
ncbi:MAG: hypothetical protein ACRD09_15340 [Vicinamibacterales bacterium]